MIPTDTGPVWLIDATTYRRPLEDRLHRSKDRFFRLERQARSNRIGSFAPRGTRTFSAGLLRIATILAAVGYEVRYLELHEAIALLEGTPPGKRPSVLGFGAVCPTVPACAAASELAKRRIPGVRTVLGGAHAMVAAQLITERFPQSFDQVSRGFDLEAAAAIVGMPARRPGPASEQPDYGLLPRPLVEYGLNLMTATGCPFSCNYCQDRLVPRTRGPLDGGLGWILDGWPLPEYTPVHFSDSVLGGSVPRALQVCRELAELDHGVLLSCDLRPEFITPDLVVHLRKAGFVEVRMGLDSGDEGVLANARRLARPTRLLEALAVIRETSKLYVSIYMVTGLPGTTRGTLDRNLRIVERLLEEQLADQIKHHLYVPYPTDQCRTGSPGVRPRVDDWAAYDRNSYPVYDIPGLGQDELWEAFLITEEAINAAWTRSLGVSEATIASLERFPDYNGAMYLGNEGSVAEAPTIPDDPDLG